MHILFAEREGKGYRKKENKIKEIVIFLHFIIYFSKNIFLNLQQSGA